MKGLEELANVVAVERKEPTLLPLLTDNEERQNAVDAVALQLNKQFKTEASIVKLGNRVGKPIASVNTGIYTFDYDAVGSGGFPRGRISEVIGPESSGKTSFMLNTIGQEQKRGGLCALVDAEHALGVTWAANLGVDVDNLLISQPDSGEQGLETVLALVHSRAVSLIVVDSVAALTPQAELDGEIGDSFMGLQARMMGQAMRKLRGIVAQTGATVIFTNQIREKIGVMFGSNETTPGGRALKFYASLRVDVRRRDKIMDGTELIGHKIALKIIKNKMAAPFKETDIELMYATGFDVDSDLLVHAVNRGIVEKSGGWYTFKGKKVRKEDLLENKAAIIKELNYV